MDFTFNCSVPLSSTNAKDQHLLWKTPNKKAVSNNAISEFIFVNNAFSACFRDLFMMKAKVYPILCGSL